MWSIGRRSVTGMSPGRRLPATHRELLDLLPDWGSTARERRKTLRVIAARDAVAAAEEELRSAVRETQDAGDSWLTIGVILGISRQAAQQRFRPPSTSPHTDRARALGETRTLTGRDLNAVPLPVGLRARGRQV